MTTQLVVSPVVSPVVISDDAIVQRMQQYHYLISNSAFQFKQHQYDGVKWCITNELRPNPPGNVHGGFIADEMGLGKTIMIIGTMFVNFLQRTLIVVPPSLIQQWFMEIFTVSGHKALVFYGHDKKHITQAKVNAAPIVLTTYNTLLDKDCLLGNIVWSRIVFDEAHHLRNARTMRFKACKNIKASIRWLVTGTPIQNKPKDFYNMCSACGIDPRFYNDPVNLMTIRKYFVLRRTKLQVGINLHPVTSVKQVVNWKTRAEMQFAEDIHSMLPGITRVTDTKRKRLSIEHTGTGTGILPAILMSRQVCILPALMINRLKLLITDDKSEQLDIINYTSKLDAVIQLMTSRKDNGNGKIVFCHFQREIDIISSRLEKTGFKKVIRYDGRNSGGDNLASLSEPADALVIQIQTGCEGLNLQQNFSEIYFVSPHWNPSVEDQAIARCHRIGQVKPVEVFKFEMNGFSTMENCEAEPVITLEKYINIVQDNKRDISKTLIGI